MPGSEVEHLADVNRTVDGERNAPAAEVARQYLAPGRREQSHIAGLQRLARQRLARRLLQQHELCGHGCNRRGGGRGPRSRNCVRLAATNGWGCRRDAPPRPGPRNKRAGALRGDHRERDAFGAVDADRTGIGIERRRNVEFGPRYVRAGRSHRRRPMRCGRPSTTRVRSPSTPRPGDTAEQAGCEWTAIGLDHRCARPGSEAAAYFSHASVAHQYVGTLSVPLRRQRVHAGAADEDVLRKRRRRRPHQAATIKQGDERSE